MKVTQDLLNLTTPAVGDATTKAATMAALASAISALPAPDVIAERQVPIAASPVNGVVNTWSQLPLTNITRNTLGGTINSGNLVIPAGSYLIEFESVHREAAGQFLNVGHRLYDVNNSIVLESRMSGCVLDYYNGASYKLRKVLTLPTTTTLQLQYYHGGGAGQLGQSDTLSGAGFTYFTPVVLCAWKLK